MSKLISQLPEDVRVVALQRQQTDSDCLKFAFLWDATPEGHEIWMEVNNDNYTPFREFHAKHQPENNGWISVEERLPDDRRKSGWNSTLDVNILMTDDEGHYIVTTGLYLYDENRWIEHIYNNTYNKHIIHWQPLPPPPAKN
jgi:hypothetical protein